LPLSRCHLGRGLRNRTQCAAIRSETQEAGVCTLVWKGRVMPVW
jgi:hypothetical protein